MTFGGWQWRGRNASLFGPLRTCGNQPVVELLSLGSKHADQLAARWLKLDGDSAIMKAVAYEHRRLWLRHAALDWHTPEIEGEENIELIGAWLLDAADAYTTVTQRCREDVALYCNPRVQLDVLGRTRIAFLPGGGAQYDVPPEVRGKAFAWDERSMVYMAGSVVLQRALFAMGGKSPVGDVVLKCLEAKPAKRWQSVEDLRHALATELRLGLERLPRRHRADRFVDEGLAWLEPEYPFKRGMH